MIDRQLGPVIAADLHEVPVVVLVGPRQIGKTTLARSVDPSATYLDMERPGDRARLADPDTYLRGRAGHLTVIDEVHRVPDLFPILRGVVDDRRAAGERGGHALLLGSAGLDLIEHSGETLAGRIRVRELAGVGVDEFADEQSLWLRGGFPEALLASSDAASLRWRQDLVQSYLVREVPMFAPRLPANTIERLWVMLAHMQGGIVNRSRLAEALGVSTTAVSRYLDLLEDLHLVRLLPPWSGNIGKRLVRSPKVYVRDSGLVHALLGLATMDDLLGHPVVGGSFEGWVIEQVAARQGAASLMFYRTQAGAEVDLVIERGGRVDTVIEIKRSSAPAMSRGFRTALDDLKPSRAFVVHPGTERFPLTPSVEAIGVRELLAEVSQE